MNEFPYAESLDDDDLMPFTFYQRKQMGDGVRTIPPPGPSVTLCRAPGACCQSRRCAVIAWSVFAVFCACLIGGFVVLVRAT